jgi:transcriptional regulator of acetoin/glycerol metabolism
MTADALRRANGNKSRAAAALGLSRTQLLRRLRRFGLTA